MALDENCIFSLLSRTQLQGFIYSRYCSPGYASVQRRTNIS